MAMARTKADMVSVIAHRVVVHGSHSGYTVTAELFMDTQPGGHPC
ncbi:hypothetical protein GCM10010270_40910 [Streptomyces violaceus]|nr:hypothetical protein GCM10010270_40910 [Streptomyces janthinus]